MKQFRFLAALLLAFAPLLGAQRAPAFELGAFLQFSKYDDFTGLKNGIGGGGRFGLYLLRNIALEYEADVTKTQSSRLGDLTALNNRIDAIFYFPVGSKLRLLAGGGWTGTQYHSDTTKNQFDSGANAVIGFKYCVNENWALRGDVNADFKDPSDQTLSGERTRTYNVRFGFSRFLGGRAKNSPCFQSEPMAPAPRPMPAVVPVAPVPVQAPPPPPPPPAVVRTVPVIPPPPPTPVPTPVPTRRELLTLNGAHFAFDRFNLTAAARDTLQQVVTLLKAQSAAKVEIQGHADWIGTDEYNQALSERRANSVKDYLVSQGIAASRITTRGFGKGQPITSNETANGRADNRRVVIIEIQ